MTRDSAALIASLAVILFWNSAPARGQASVLTQHNDIARTGANLNETILNCSNVKASQFGKLFSRSVDGQIYAQPLYVPGVSIADNGIHNVVYVATMNNSVYAFDADDPNASKPLWKVNLGPPVPYQDTVAAGAPSNINPLIGITSTPVIEPLTETIYCVAKTKENSSYFQRLHALDITSGHEKFGGPVLIQATVSGTGEGSVSGTLSFNPRRQLNRPALLYLDGVIYLAFGSHSDFSPYHGWVIAYDATTLQRVAVFNSTPTGRRGGIWQAGQGLAADENGYIYFMTGNGSFDYNTGGANLGMSFVKLATPDLSVVDWFTPYNVVGLNDGDKDLASAGPLLLPGTNLVVGGGKEQMLHLLNRSNMGHFHAGSNSQIVQNFQATAGHIHGSPIYWNSPNQGPLIYIWSEEDYLKAFKLLNGSAFQTTPVAKSTMAVPAGMPGAMLSLSANQSVAGTAIVWASHPYAGDAVVKTVPGILRAFDASNISTELWNSKQNAARDDLGNFGKFCPPTVVHGKVYLATFSNQLIVYGLLSPPSLQVSITAPRDRGAFTAPANISITAVTSDTEGSVTKVDFFNNGALLGTDSSSPYGLSWSQVPAGSYTLTARATDDDGTTAISAPINVTVNEASGIPAAPTNLVGTLISIRQIDLAWTDNSTNEQGFKIERSTDGTTFTLIAKTAINATTFSDRWGLSPYTRYYYRVKAFNSFGGAYSNKITVKTLPVP